MADSDILNKLAFKGGTAIRKLHLGNQGRFSLDLDFTSLTSTEPEEMILEVVEVFNDRSYFGLSFGIDPDEFYATDDSCGAEITYNHDWVSAGRFAVQISFRAQPALPVRQLKMLSEQYFDWLGVVPPEPTSLDLHEIIGEKIRAAAQRNRVRDLYDLYQFSTRPFDRDLVRQVAVIKCWETNFALDPENFLKGIQSGDYDWGDLRRLVRRSWELYPDQIIQAVREGYKFLLEMTAEESQLAVDPYKRQRQVYTDLLERLRNQF